MLPLGVTKKSWLKSVNPTFAREQKKVLIHRKQAKINIFFHNFPFLGQNKPPWFWIFEIGYHLPMKQLTSIKLVYVTFNQLVSCFLGKWWRISKIQNHGGSFWPNNGKQWKTTSIFVCFLWFSMNWIFLLFAGKCRVDRF